MITFNKLLLKLTSLSFSPSSFLSASPSSHHYPRHHKYHHPHHHKYHHPHYHPCHHPHQNLNRKNKHGKLMVIWAWLKSGQLCYKYHKFRRRGCQYMIVYIDYSIYKAKFYLVLIQFRCCQTYLWTLKYHGNMDTLTENFVTSTS